jgi:ech hydrogenase subunit D
MTPQTILDITIPELPAKVRELQSQGNRLAQICCTKLPDKLELHYSFDRNYHYTSLRLTLADTETPVPSVSDIYWNAFLYENEVHDLFGVKISGIAVDYKGQFYRTAIPTPFNPPAPTGEVKT